jgi:hypothetical protein
MPLGGPPQAISMLHFNDQELGCDLQASQTINTKVYVYDLSFGCGLRKSLKVIRIRTRPACCRLLYNYMLQALGEVVERPAGFCFSDKMTTLNFCDMYVVLSTFLVNIWPSSCGLRPSKLILVNGGEACRPTDCVLIA